MGVLPHVREQDTQPVLKQFSFSGAWIPDLDPTKIGEDNFATLRNFRYIDGGISPIEGTTLLTDSNPADSSYLYPKDAIQLRSAYGDALVAVMANSDDSAERIYIREVDIPDTGNWDSNYIYTPNTNFQQARLGQLPRGVGYANEYESVIWEGDTALPGAVIRSTSTTTTNPYVANPDNVTEKIRNLYEDSENVFTVDSQFCWFLIGVTRPMTSFDVTIGTANSGTGAMGVAFWAGTVWTTVAGTDDGTQPGGGSTLQQDGTVTWTTNSQATIQPCYIEGAFLYWYKVYISLSPNATIAGITVNMPCQTIKDVWDGVYRTCISAEVYIAEDSEYNDYLLEVNEPSNIEYPVAMKLGDLNSSGYMELAFEERSCGVLFEVIAEAQNVGTAYFNVYYWNGTSYAAVSWVLDETRPNPAAAATSLARTGTISWQPISKTLEKMRTKQGVTGFFYKFVPTGAMGTSGYDVLVDLVSGIPRHRVMNGHKFCATYGQRSFWCGDIYGREANAMDYGPPNTVDVFNGMQSSDRGQRIYVGDNAELTGASSIYNRFGSSIYETMLIFKDASTHLMYGTGPGDYRLYTISQTYGCPAPHTIATAEIGYEMGGGAYRNVCMWLSYKGPVIFDGASLIPLPGVDLYFDPRKENTYLNFDRIKYARGWFDPFWKEYHLQFCVGSSYTYNNTHIVYDLARKRWFEIYFDAGSTSTGSGWPQVTIPARTPDGSITTLAFMNDGLIYQFGKGPDWHGNDLTHVVKTADFFVGESIWIESKMQAIRVGHEVPDFSITDDPITISVNYYVNGQETAIPLDDFTISRDDHITEVYLLEEDSDYILGEDDDPITYDAVVQRRYVTKTQHLNKVGLTHQFQFSRVNTSVSYLGNFGKNFLWWGFLARPEGMDQR